ncbi:targeting protein for Xklp2 [Drosophila grimshawi]|uniref:targeting protein for Xklp2 n=1 Tax=Drosophila grimshawi TaxID=7222 RepID=UPI000C8700E0|nr:targeting protein for Xklp2 [Drosophila grimshawi]
MLSLRQPKDKNHLNESLTSGIEKFAVGEETVEPNLEKIQHHESVIVGVLEKQHKQFPEYEGTAMAVRKSLAPKAYCFKDIYEQKKQRVQRQRLELERAQRQFHSRPMPNFNHAHQQLVNKQDVQRITLAVTPNVLKTSRDMQLKRLQRVEQALQQREQEQLQLQKMRPQTKPVPKCTAPPLKPFSRQPKQTCPLAFKPFHFSTEVHAEQRKMFNAHSHQLQETRRREQEEELKRLERELYRKQRQLTIFRARPNPFR